MPKSIRVIIVILVIVGFSIAVAALLNLESDGVQIIPNEGHLVRIHRGSGRPHFDIFLYRYEDKEYMIVDTGDGVAITQIK